MKLVKNIKMGELFLALETYFLSFILWFYPVFDHARSYQFLGKVADEKIWSLLFFTISVLQMVGMIGKKKKIRLLGLLGASASFVLMGTGFFISEVGTTAWGTYILLGIYASYLHYVVYREE